MTATTSPTTDDAPPRKPGRPRSAQAHQAILDATLRLLIEEGYRGLSLEQVAARAHVGKTTIYRRWSSKQDLVIEAVAQLTNSAPLVETGDTRADILRSLHAGLSDMRSMSGQVLLRLVGEMTMTSELWQAFLERGVAPDITATVRLIQHGQERGDVRTDLDPLVIMGMLAGPFLMFVFAGLEPTEDMPERILAAVWEGIAVH